LKTLLTFDYEVFFGRRTGSPERCLLEPTDALVRIAGRHGAPLTFFVDAGYLLALRREMRTRTPLRLAHDAICRQLSELSRRGHQLQLHIHPHWEDARWKDGEWRLDLARYALHSFDPAQIGDIVKRYLDVLRDLGGPASGTAYRAGGWVIQPFERLRNALRFAGVKIDSTVYPGGHRAGPVQPFDFRNAPARSRWRFEHDPLVEDPKGSFLEVPIASREVKPAFFWRLALARKAGGTRHRAFGDGQAIAMDAGELKSRLTRPSTSVVSVDGYKASFLEDAAEDYRRLGREDFVVIGHPKALTPYSLDKLDQFLAGKKGGELANYGAYA
jgi:peptidoglycan/xylan/chitin deacetylase (PgdA/CDA1 family)